LFLSRVIWKKKAILEYLKPGVSACFKGMVAFLDSNENKSKKIRQCKVSEKKSLPLTLNFFTTSA